jgi:transcriptional regulator with XRE-family HTH domain
VAGQEKQFETSVESLAGAYQDAVAAIESTPDLLGAFDMATTLATTMRGNADAANRLRARTAAKLRDAEGLSLAQLAQRIGISKARADQLVRAADSAAAKPVLVDEATFSEQLQTLEHTAFRLELQPAYAVPYEQATVARFLAGDPQSPTEVDELRAWYDQIASLTRSGRTVERVRVHEDPPTGYQRWERWAGAWNIHAGEVIRYMTRQRAFEVGLLPAAGDADWWLLDSTRLLLMRFDAQGCLLSCELVSQSAVVRKACRWRDLAVRSATQ